MSRDREKQIALVFKQPRSNSSSPDIVCLQQLAVQTTSEHTKTRTCRVLEVLTTPPCTQTRTQRHAHAQRKRSCIARFVEVKLQEGPGGVCRSACQGNGGALQILCKICRWTESRSEASAALQCNK
eukprot:2007130-Amphidinium_carterae.1